MEAWLFLEQRASAPAWNMACDEWLLFHIEKSRKPILRTYEWGRPSVTIGYFQSYPSELESKYTIVRRPTGGALVYHDSDLTFTVVLPSDHEWKKLRTEDRYFKIHERIQKIFESRGVVPCLAPVAAVYDRREKNDDGHRPPLQSTLPIPSGRSSQNDQCFVKHTRYDVLVGTLKVAGGAQRSTREGLLHQGSIQGGGQSRVTSEELRSAWETFGVRFSDAKLSTDDFGGIQSLAQMKYALPEWNKKHPREKV